MRKQSSRRKLQRISRKVLRQNNQTKTRRRSLPLVLLTILLAGLFFFHTPKQPPETTSGYERYFEHGEIPIYDGEPYIELAHGPFFQQDGITGKAEFEQYSELDWLGRCGVAMANLSPALMPNEERGPIGMVKPSGWHTVKYPELIEDNYLYNRCHLIAFSLAGENANEKNLITGTRYFNVQGMQVFERKVADYIWKTGNHVLYRVTPVFEDQNLVATGVIMEAYSVEDDGKGICFNVFVFNVQPGIEIDYSDGSSWVAK